MAVVYAVKSGDWSDITTWNTGSLPTSWDDVYANTYSIIVDQDIEVVKISTESASGISAGGSFTNQWNTSTETRTITADIYAGGSDCFIEAAVLVDNSLIFNSNIYGSDSTSGIGVKFTPATGNAGIISITGNIHGGTKGYGLLPPDYYGGGGSNTPFVINGGIYSRKVRAIDFGTLASYKVTINGDIHGMSAASGQTVYVDGPYLTVNGNLVSESYYQSYPVYSLSGVVINGNVSAYGGIGLYLNAINPSVINGNVYASATFNGVKQLSSGIVAVNGHIYDDESGVSAVQALRGPFPVSDGEMIIHTYGFNSSTIGQAAMSLTDTEITLVYGDAGSDGECPEPYDVRKGVIYGSKTGTLAVPNPLEVAFGIPTDNTVGQAAISLVQLSGITGEQIAAAFEK